MCKLIKKDVIDVYAIFSNKLFDHFFNIYVDELNDFIDQVDIFIEKENYERIYQLIEDLNLIYLPKYIDLNIIQFVIVSHRLYNYWLISLKHKYELDDIDLNCLSDYKKEMKSIFYNDGFLKIKNKLTLINELMNRIKVMYLSKKDIKDEVTKLYDEIIQYINVVISYCTNVRIVFKEKCCSLFTDNIISILNYLIMKGVPDEEIKEFIKKMKEDIDSVLER